MGDTFAITLDGVTYSGHIDRVATGEEPEINGDLVCLCPYCMIYFSVPGHAVGGVKCSCGEHDHIQIVEVRRNNDVLPAAQTENAPAKEQPAPIPQEKIAESWYDNLTGTDKKIVDAMRQYPDGAYARDVSRVVGKERTVVRNHMDQLCEIGLAQREKLGCGKTSSVKYTLVVS